MPAIIKCVEIVWSSFLLAAKEIQKGWRPFLLCRSHAARQRQRNWWHRVRNLFKDSFRHPKDHVCQRSRTRVLLLGFLIDIAAAQELLVHMSPYSTECRVLPDICVIVLLQPSLHITGGALSQPTFKVSRCSGLRPLLLLLCILADELGDLSVVASCQRCLRLGNGLANQILQKRSDLHHWDRLRTLIHSLRTPILTPTTPSELQSRSP